ncbi:right-handed parallel beta-helix repeat-containing protein [Candidatus Woesearchaeota archaeon]|nr:right-handed parallel beta-helix repeat-containing protein [Candidatus Woesearchaeota archaeon]
MKGRTSTGENVRYLYRHSKNKSEDFSIRTNPGDDTLVVNYIGRDSIVNLSFGNSNNFTANTWNHIAVSWNTSNNGLLKIYRNGVVVNTQTSFSEMENYNNTIFIGGFEGNQTMNGSIDEAIFYNNRILTDTEVLDLYRSKVSVNQTFTRNNLIDGAYLWNCQAYDNNSQGAFGVANWSVTVGDDAPVVNLSQPVNNKIFANLVNLYLECNITDDNEITNVSLFHNISTNFILNQTIDPRESIATTGNQMHVLLHLNNDSRLGENSSFAVDSLGRNNGTFKAPGQPKIDAGKFNRGVTFIGSSATGQINLSTVEALGNTNVTIMAWIKSGNWNAADGPNDYYPILTQSVSDYTGYYFYIGGTAEARRPGFDLDATGGALAPSTMNLSINRWYHVVGTHNDTHISIYVDGVIRTSKAVTGSGAKKAAYIGFDDVSDYFNGSIDEVVIYNRTLTSAEINAHYAYTKTSYSANFTFPNFDQTGSYKWNCLAVDDANQNSWAATNRSFVVDSCTPPKDADWVVNKVCTKNNEILSVAQDYNLNISRDGKLHFSNVTLIINQTADGRSFINVTGFFNITRASNITSVKNTFEFDFQVSPGGNLNASDSYFSEMGYSTDNIGLTISSPGAFLMNNSFTDIIGISMTQGNYTFVDNRFFGDIAATIALTVSGALSNISSNTIENVTGAIGGDSDIGIYVSGNQNLVLHNTVRNIGGKQTGGGGEIGYGIYIEGNDNKVSYNNVSNNDALSTSSAGILVATSFTNNNITNNTISYNTNEYNGILLQSSTPGNRIINNTIQYNNRYQIISAGDTVISQNIIQMNGRQIAAGDNVRMIDTGGRDNITENFILVSGGSFADTIFVDTNNNNITNNNITTKCSSCYGITFRGGDFNIFNRNNITTTGASGNGIDASSSIVTTSNNFSRTRVEVTASTAYGIYIDGLANANFTFNDTTIVAGSGIGIYTSTPNNKFFDTSVNTTIGPGVLLITNAFNNTFIGLRINASTGAPTIGFRMSGTGVRDNLIKDFNILGKDEGVEFDANTSQNLFLDGEVSSGTDADDYNLYIIGGGGGRVNTLLNVTLIQNTTSFSTSGDFIIDKQWYLDVFANYSNATNAVNANVTALQVNQSFSFSGLTGTNGFIVQRNLTEYRENSTTKTFFTNYTVNVSQTGFVTLQRPVNMTYNRIEYFTFANVAPTVPTLTAPSINNYTTNRTPEFVWSASTDIEHDLIVYDLILECLPIGGGTCSSDNRVFANLTGTSYLLLYDIRLLQDNGWFYNWTVRAWDNKSYSNNATKRNLTVASYIAISLPTDNINFTSIVPGQSATSYNTAQMTTSRTLNVSNDGNAITNVSVTESEALWDSLNKRPEHFSLNISHGDPNYGSKGACSVGYRNWGYGTAAWFPIPSSSSAGHICQLSYLNQSDRYNSASVYINITVPPDEAGGQKNARLTFTAYLAE